MQTEFYVVEHKERTIKHTKRWSELVPTTELVKMREYDRETDPNPWRKDPHYLDTLETSIKEHGILESVILDYSMQSGKMSIAEGNHRLAVALRLGIEFIPCRVVVTERGDKERHGKSNCETTGIDEWHNQYGSLPSHFNITTKKL